MRTARRWLLVQLGVISIAIATGAFVPGVRASGSDDPVGLDSAQVVTRMVAHNQERARTLDGYRSRRHYHLDYSGMLGSRQADMVVDVYYRSPSEKDFQVVSESGSKWICNHVLRRLMEVEKENTQPAAHERTEISPENYTFTLLTTERALDGTLYYVLQAEPRSENSYLFRGKLWVEGHDFAVARIEGEPAKNPSRWTKQSDFHHVYVRLDGFWLPAKNDTLTQLHLLGHSHLTIEYRDYHVTRAQAVSGNL